jgi:carbonic anhydrase
MMVGTTESKISRRHLLRLGALTSVGMAVLTSSRGNGADAGPELSRPRPTPTPTATPVYCNSQRPMTPAEALVVLVEGNERWATGKQTHPGEDEARRTCNAKNPQTPFAALLACIDSRVPPELVFDQGVGDLFPARVAGNSVVPILEDSLRFGTEVLKASLLFVLGHSSCGAVIAATEYFLDHLSQFSSEPLSPNVSLPPAFVFIEPILPAVKAARKIVKKRGGDPNSVSQVAPVATDQHVILTVQYLLSRQPFKRLVKDGKLLVKGGRYDLGTQEVTILV